MLPVGDYDQRNLNGVLNMKVLGHLRTINHHKMLVMKYCFKVGLYKQGLLHDLSKYSPTEFLVGCRYYQGTRSPNNAEREATGYSRAWLHHKGRNKHHYEYWIDYSVDPGEGIVGQKMPVKYVIEMFLDRVAASKTYKGDAYTDQYPLKYYQEGTEKLGKMVHPDTARLLHKLLKLLADRGEEEAFRYIRERMKELRPGFPAFVSKFSGWLKKVVDIFRPI